MIKQPWADLEWADDRTRLVDKSWMRQGRRQSARQAAPGRRSPCRSEQLVENAEKALPVLGPGVLEIAIDDLEGAGRGQGLVRAAIRGSRASVSAASEVERRQRGHMIEHGRSLTSLLSFPNSWTRSRSPW
jgi:hypothetical protein